MSAAAWLRETAKPTSRTLWQVAPSEVVEAALDYLDRYPNLEKARTFARESGIDPRAIRRVTVDAITYGVSDMTSHEWVVEMVDSAETDDFEVLQ